MHNGQPRDQVSACHKKTGSLDPFSVLFVLGGIFRSSDPLFKLHLLLLRGLDNVVEGLGGKAASGPDEGQVISLDPLPRSGITPHGGGWKSGYDSHIAQNVLRIKPQRSPVLWWFVLNGYLYAIALVVV